MGRPPYKYKNRGMVAMLHEVTYNTCAYNIYLEKEKLLFSCDIGQKIFFDQKSALQAAFDASIARVSGCICPRE